MPGCIVVGVRDGQSAATVAYAADVAHDRGLAVLAVHAYPPAPPLEDPTWVQDMSWLTDIVANEWCHALRVRGIEYRALAVACAPAAALQAAAEHARAELVVVGQPRRSRSRRWWRGPSVAGRLTEGLTQPLVVVPPIPVRRGADLRRVERGTRTFVG